MTRFLCFLLLFAGYCLGLSAQQADEQLAAQYFNNNEYDKAAVVYEKLLQKNPSSVYVYDNLLQSYLNLSEYSEAEKLVKKQQRRFNENFYYKVDLGYVYKKSGQADKASKYFEELINQSKGLELQTMEMANAFQKRAETDLAVRTYLRARKLNGNNSSLFAIPLAQLYGDVHDKKSMIQEYLNALEANPTLEEDIQGYLQLSLEETQDFELLRLALLKRNKDSPGADVFSEMLTWLYVQRKDFDNAMVQAKALDKRYKENGRRVFELSALALQNGRYDAAINGYALDKGKRTSVYASQYN